MVLTCVYLQNIVCSHGLKKKTSLEFCSSGTEGEMVSWSSSGLRLKPIRMARLSSVPSGFLNMAGKSILKTFIQFGCSIAMFDCRRVHCFFESSKIGIVPIWKRHIKYRYIWILKHGTNLWEEVVNLPFWNGPCWHNFHPVTQRQLSGSAVSPINPNPNHLKLMFFRFVDQTMMKIKFYGNDENQVSSVGNDEHQVLYGLDQLVWKVQISILFKFYRAIWLDQTLSRFMESSSCSRLSGYRIPLDFWRRSVFCANWALLSGIDDNLRQLRHAQIATTKVSSNRSNTKNGWEMPICMGILMGTSSVNGNSPLPCLTTGG